MTIQNALDGVKLVRPSQFDDAAMIGWLADLDGQIDTEIIRTHEGAPEEAYVRYVAGEGGTDLQTQLIVPAPYDKLYISYLMAQIDFYTAEYDRFNNDQRRFEIGFGEFVNWYNRVYMPIGERYVRVGRAQRDEGLPAELS